MKKHLFLLLFAIVASVSTTSAAITVRLDPQSCSSWSTVRLWAWTSAGNVFNAWPGEIVSKDGDGWYAYTFDESITEVSIIWNNGTAQTVDITGIIASTCYALNSTSGTTITVRVVDCPSNPNPEPQTIEHVQIGSLYYNLNGTNRTAEVTYQMKESNYSLTSANIPSSVTYNSYTYRVTSIGKYAFYDCVLTSVTIPNSVTSIGMYAFCGCTSLTSITIPNSVTSIGYEAFRYCSSLTSVTIGNSVTSIGRYAFSYCNIASINFLGTLADWCNKSWSPFDITYGIYYTLSLNGVLQTDITIPNSLTSISESVFLNCSSLTSVTIPNSVTSIGSSAFSYCTSLTSVTIPNSVTSIGSSAFYGCSGLTSVTIPNSTTSIANYAFYECSSLTSVTIGNSVASIGVDAFRNCSSLTSITIPNSVTSIANYAFCGCSSLTSVTIGNNVASIGEWAFCNCSSLTSVTIPNSVTRIRIAAFNGCSSLTSITIGNGIISIGDGAFYFCSSLTSVTVNATTPPTLGDAAFEIIDTLKIYVPAASVTAYKGAWTAYADLIFAISGGEPDPAKYYIVGTMNSWQVDENYEMNPSLDAETEEYFYTLDLTTTSEFKVVKVQNGEQSWIPEGMGNNYGQNGEITENGEYTVYFRPNFDGGEDWFYSCIYAEKTGEFVPEEPTYYLIGNMTGWDVDENYELNPNIDSDIEEYFYVLDLTTSSLFKVVKVQNGQQSWFPEGMGNSYGENGEITEDGEYTVYFRPNYNGGEDWFYNCIYVSKNEEKPEQTAIDNIVLTEKAQKVIVDGVVYIVRDGKLFNLQGQEVR